MIKPKFPIRERICIFGDTDCGKTFQFLTLASSLINLGSSANFYVIDTDDGIYKNLYCHFQDLHELIGKRIFIFECTDFDSVQKALDSIEKKLKREDWVCVDLFCSLYPWAQAHYVKSVFQKDPNSYYIEARKKIEASGKKQGVLEGFFDWPYIKSLYKDLVHRILKKLKCNTVCLCSSRILEDTERSKMANSFGKIGRVPNSHKTDPHSWDTVLFAKRTKEGGFMLRSVKDRGRQHRDFASSNFVFDYLVAIAGWEIS